MKQLLILSGKGGTGKTTIASAFIKLADAKAFADCDVDAPNLHLISKWDIQPEKADYYGLDKAEIDQSLCIQCDLCRQHCRFDAISVINNEYTVNKFSCEGCSVCEYICPAKAMTMVPSIDGELVLYADGEKAFSTAKLKMGSGNSGLLVTEVKKRMSSAAAVDAKLAIIDGSPGIGCPVIASLSGVDMVLIVAEPSLSGISDMERIIDTASRFGTQIAVSINKFDTNIINTKNIEALCRKYNLPLVGNIPFDPSAIKAINNGLTIVDINCPAGTAVKKVFEQTMSLLFQENGEE